MRLTDDQITSRAWWVLQVKGQHEFPTEQRLHKAGLIAFCPFDKRIRPIVRVRRQRRVDRIPLFARWVFVRCDDALDVAMAQRFGGVGAGSTWVGVEGVLSRDGRPIEIGPFQMLAFIRQCRRRHREIEAGEDARKRRAERARRPISPGDVVALRSRLLGEGSYTVEAVDGAYLKCRTAMLGGERLVDLHVDSVERRV